MLPLRHEPLAPPLLPGCPTSAALTLSQVWQRVSAPIRNAYITFAFSGGRAGGAWPVGGWALVGSTDCCSLSAAPVRPGSHFGSTPSLPHPPTHPPTPDFNLEEKLQPKKGEDDDDDDGCGWLALPMACRCWHGCRAAAQQRCSVGCPGTSTAASRGAGSHPE